MTLLKEEPVLSEESVHGFACDIATALQHMHSNGLVSPEVFPTILAVYTDIAGKRRHCIVSTLQSVHARMLVDDTHLAILLMMCAPVRMCDNSNHHRCTAT